MPYAKMLQLIHAKQVWSGAKTIWLTDKIAEDKALEIQLDIATERTTEQWLESS